MIQCDCQENIERICKIMCQSNYTKKNKEKKYYHLNFIEKTQIERWYNIEKKSCSEIAKLLNKSVRTIQREIKRGLQIGKIYRKWDKKRKKITRNISSRNKKKIR